MVSLDCSQIEKILKESATTDLGRLNNYYDYKKEHDKPINKLISLFKKEKLELLEEVLKKLENYECILNEDAHKEANGKCHVGFAMMDLIDYFKDIKKAINKIRK